MTTARPTSMRKASTAGFRNCRFWRVHGDLTVFAGGCVAAWRDTAPTLDALPGWDAGVGVDGSWRATWGAVPWPRIGMVGRSPEFVISSRSVTNRGAHVHIEMSPS
jgi:hypothetical protein